jgi:hypothetical protein
VSAQQVSVCLRVIDLHGDELETGTIITAESNRRRIHSTDIREDE